MDCFVLPLNLFIFSGCLGPYRSAVLGCNAFDRWSTFKKKLRVERRPAGVDRNAVHNFEKIASSVLGFIMGSEIGSTETAPQASKNRFSGKGTTSNSLTPAKSTPAKSLLKKTSSKRRAFQRDTAGASGSPKPKRKNRVQLQSPKLKKIRNRRQ